MTESASENKSAKLYRERKERFGALAADLSKKSRSISHLRGIAFIAAGGALLVGILAEPLAVWFGVILALAFVALLFVHARVLEKLEDAERWADVNERALSRVTGRWRDLADTGASLRPDGHPYAEDLDLFGHGSLYQRVSVAHTRYGQCALRDYLCEPVELAESSLRQGAVRDLVGELELRQRFEALSIAAVQTLAEQAGKKDGRQREAPDPEPFFQWATGEWKPSAALLLRVASWVLPTWTVVGIVGSFALAWPMAVWIVPLVLQLFCIAASREAAGQAFHALTATEGTLRRYAPMLALVETLESDSVLLKRLREQLDSATDRPSEAMAGLWRVAGWFALRENGMVHPFINALLLWDLHCTFRLEAWRQRHGASARAWFDVLGTFEAVSSFAGLAHDDEEHCWPELDSARAHFEAQDLAHPLIDPEQRVGNDVVLPAAGHALLITGSNMSGKSTFLRSMGIAAVMASAGAPVCARRLSLSPLPVCTSIRISDSLEAGVSHFYAEVSRLRDVLRAAERGPVLFLLDEILHGTNSRERQIGAKWMLSELLRLDSLGVISTHDMGLCEVEPALESRVTLLHLRESVEGGRMTFDYLLRPGPVTAGNALRLMREVGLDVPV
jgi:hypothetical protein